MNICTMCGGQFEAKRADARFCSANCRQRAKRDREVSSDVCEHCKGHKGGIFTAKEFREELDKLLQAQTPTAQTAKTNTVNVSGVAEPVISYEE